MADIDRRDLDQAEDAFEEYQKEIEEIKLELKGRQDSLWDQVNIFGAMRLDFLREELWRKGLDWCTCCKNLFPYKEMKFLLTGNTKESGGHIRPGIRDFFPVFHHTCSQCFQKNFDRHGLPVVYDGAQTSLVFFAFKVEKREDGYYAREFGEWIRLEDKDCKLLGDVHAGMKDFDGRKQLRWEENATWELPQNFICKDGAIKRLEIVNQKMLKASVSA